MKNPESEKKKTMTSKKTKKPTQGYRGRPKGHTMEKFMRKYPGEDPLVNILPPETPDPEATLPEPDDEASKHKYPPPKKDPLFRSKWMRFIDNVSGRENFKVGHLDSLEILCDLYVEYAELQAIIRKKGRTYMSIGRSGEVWKFYPEVGQLKTVSTQIKDYSKLLGLLLKKDYSSESGGEKDEWA